MHFTPNGKKSKYTLIRWVNKLKMYIYKSNIYKHKVSPKKILNSQMNLKLRKN